MTKKQKLEERIKKDDEMCKSINEALDKLRYEGCGIDGEGNPYYVLGWIRNCLVYAGRRDK